MAYHSQGINAVQNTVSANAAAASSLGNTPPPSQNCSTSVGYTQNNKETERDGRGNGDKYFDRENTPKAQEEQEALKRSIKHYTKAEQYARNDKLMGALGVYGFIAVNKRENK